MENGRLMKFAEKYAKVPMSSTRRPNNISKNEKEDMMNIINKTAGVKDHLNNQKCTGISGSIVFEPVR